eukprot:3697132-Pyramimonas_sp.AAC.1
MWIPARMGAPSMVLVTMFAEGACPYLHTPRTFRGPDGSSTEGPDGHVRTISARPSHVSFPRNGWRTQLH